MSSSLYHPCTPILIEGLKSLPGGHRVLADWDKARSTFDEQHQIVQHEVSEIDLKSTLLGLLSNVMQYSDQLYEHAPEAFEELCAVQKFIERLTPTAWRREWNGDVSDLNHMIYVEDAGDLDDDGVWESLYGYCSIPEHRLPIEKRPIDE